MVTAKHPSLDDRQAEPASHERPPKGSSRSASSKGEGAEASRLGAEHPALTPQERRLALGLRGLAAFFLVGILFYLLPPFFEPLRALFAHLPFVTNSAVKMGTLGLLALFAAGDVRRYRVLVLVIVAGHVLSEVAVLLTLALADTSAVVEVFGRELAVRSLLWASVVLDGVLIALVYGLYRTADRSRYALDYLSPNEYRTASALAEVLVEGDDEVLTGAEVAQNVDKYLRQFRAEGKWLAKAALLGIEYYPLLTLRPPFSHLGRAERLAFIKKRFYRDVSLRLVPELWRRWVQAMIRFGKQLSYIGYYNDSRTYESVGYTPYPERVPEGSTREAWQKELAEARQRDRIPLVTERPEQIHGDTVQADIVIIGSGAGASVLAHELTRQGKDVVMLERGLHVDRTEMNHDEAQMLGKLYADGALQLSRDFRFQIIQGSCVGGSTVVNNGVCFDLPDEVLTRWNDEKGSSAGLDGAALAASFAAVRELLCVGVQPAQALNPGSHQVRLGVEKLGLDKPPNRFGAVEANIRGCRGCGYCNIGCQFGAKLSMLDHVLPAIQARQGTNGYGSLRILSECEAVKLDGRGRVVDTVVCRLRGQRRLDVKARTVVVAGGAIASSVLLLRSGIRTDKVGRRLAFNLGSPLVAVFDRVLKSHEGLQIAHYLEHRPSRGYIFETWWNPPASQALAMPGWFEDHYRNMRRYSRMTGLGILVGTESNGRVTYGRLTGTGIHYTPTEADLGTLTEALIEGGRLLLGAGAVAVLPGTFDYHELETERDLERLRSLVKDSSSITLGTGHPQGGNPMSNKEALGVVDPEFRVFGYDNLYVCDASVFPSSVGVNPQLTVMALAHYAGRQLGAHLR